MEAKEDGGGCILKVGVLVLPLMYSGKHYTALGWN